MHTDNESSANDNNNNNSNDNSDGNTNDDNNESDGNGEDNNKGWSGTQFKQIHAHDDDDAEEDASDFSASVTPDAGSVFSSVRNEKTAKDAKVTDEPIAVNTNVGSRTANEVAIVPGVKETTWHDDKSVTDIASFANSSDEIRVAHDSSKDSRGN